MKKRRFFIGPGAPSLMLAVVVVSMSVLGLLALLSARNDARLAQRTCDFTVQQYEAMAASEHTLAGLDAILARCAAQTDTEEAYLAAVEMSLDAIETYVNAIGMELPQEMAMDGRRISWLQPVNEGNDLSCAVELTPRGETPRYQRVEHIFINANLGIEW